jgi:hypothetical protein
MRKLIESTLVSLDGVIESPDRWALFDAESAALAKKHLDGFDAFVMGRVTYERLSANWAHVVGNPYVDRINAMPKHVVSSTLRDPGWNATVLGARCRGCDRPAQAAPRQGPHQVWHQPSRRPAAPGASRRRAAALVLPGVGRCRAAPVRGRRHVVAPPAAHRRTPAEQRFGDAVLRGAVTRAATWAIGPASAVAAPRLGPRPRSAPSHRAASS